ncbi:hypothetical protein GH714_016939 [Hevea brasiliensis]|uniref:Major facilitator superfamily (MFS) profile domain-containing protein n=1 Tax=Hevea brasiliensis TaxID=3981 RepID=A0A6A6LY15_HEVBR|nr:hypothetical protein GH714_016939 [Hevea brasiliensis]
MGGKEGEISMVSERYKVVALTACVMCLCNADRVVMSVAVVPLAAKYGWSSSFLGIVQTNTEEKSDGMGRGLWSLATLLTPWAANHSTFGLLAIRAFFGLAEGVALPSMSTLLSRWFPSHERASAVGISMAGFHLGNVIGLLLTPIMLSTIGISGPFILFASLGLLWLTTWASGVTSDPRDSPFISKSELRLIQAGAASDSLIKAGYSITLVRKIMQSIGFIGPGVSLVCLNFAKTPVTASMLITAALSLSSFSQAGFLLNMQDIAPQYAGFLHGIANSAGTFAAIVSTIGTGYFVQWLGSFQAFLTVTAGLYFVTTIFWNMFATGERVF